MQRRYFVQLARPPTALTCCAELLWLEQRGTRNRCHQTREIKGWMEAMTMEFPVESESEFRSLRVGDEITATVYVRDLDYWICNAGELTSRAGKIVRQLSKSSSVKESCITCA